MKEISFDLEFQNFYCQITGKQVLDPSQFQSSPVMVFAFLHPYEYFEHLQDDLKEKFSEDFKDDGKHGELYLKLTEEVLKDEPNHLWFTHGGSPFGFDLPAVFVNVDNLIGFQFIVIGNELIDFALLIVPKSYSSELKLFIIFIDKSDFSSFRMASSTWSGILNSSVLV